MDSWTEPLRIVYYILHDSGSITQTSNIGNKQYLWKVTKKLSKNYPTSEEFLLLTLYHNTYYKIFALFVITNMWHTFKFICKYLKNINVELSTILTISYPMQFLVVSDPQEAYIYGWWFVSNNEVISEVYTFFNSLPQVEVEKTNKVKWAERMELYVVNEGLCFKKTWTKKTDYKLEDSDECNSFSCIFICKGFIHRLIINHTQLGYILITQFLMCRALTALLERCILCTFYLLVLKIFMSLLGFESMTFNLEKKQKATKLTTLPKRLCNRVACFV